MSYGATHFCLNTLEERKKKEFEFDLVLCTANSYDISAWMPTLRPEGKFVTIGCPDWSEPWNVNAFDLIMYSRSIVGSLVGSLSDTSEVL
jgi:D-arabinose 1-dehydrogenase-like Zn-dependent alcohol dehydrogenase